MKIWIVFQGDYEGDFFRGAFSSEEKAREYMAKWPKNDKLYIEEDEIDSELDVSP